MTVASTRGAKAKADKLCSLLVRARGRCQSCGESNYSKLACCHIVGRGYATTRCDTDNCLCLCGTCHHSFDNFVDYRLDLLERTIGMDEYHRLKRKALDGVGKKVDWAAEAAALAERWKEVA